MFTGLVEEIGRVDSIRALSLDACELTVCCAVVHRDASIGSSIAVNGCCLTVVRRDEQKLTFEAGAETLGRTTLRSLTSGSKVNLERAARLIDRMGGHLVTGHIDGTGTICRRDDSGPWSTFEIESCDSLISQMAAKGSIAVDGVSLTIVAVTPTGFSVALVPHTLSATTMGERRIGERVNVETDLIAKYVQRQWSRNYLAPVNE